MARLKGARNRVYHRQPVARDRIWQSMRMQRRFTVPDLMATAEASRDNAIKYVRALTKAGIVRVAAPRRSGYKGGHQVWQLIMDLGPLAPRVQTNHQVYDPNAHQVLEMQP